LRERGCRKRRRRRKVVSSLWPLRFFSRLLLDASEGRQRGERWKTEE
jgi:hypothetical protein